MEKALQLSFESNFNLIENLDGGWIENNFKIDIFVMWYEPQASNIQPWNKITTMLPQMPIYINPSQADSKGSQAL